MLVNSTIYIEYEVLPKSELTRPDIWDSDYGTDMIKHGIIYKEIILYLVISKCIPNCIECTLKVTSYIMLPHWREGKLEQPTHMYGYDITSPPQSYPNESCWPQHLTSTERN